MQKRGRKKKNENQLESEVKEIEQNTQMVNETEVELEVIEGNIEIKPEDEPDGLQGVTLTTVIEDEASTLQDEAEISESIEPENDEDVANEVLETELVKIEEQEILETELVKNVKTLTKMKPIKVCMSNGVSIPSKQLTSIVGGIRIPHPSTEPIPMKRMHT